MKLYKLNFESYLHVGTGFQEETIDLPGSDTLFLAIATMIAEIYGENELKEFCNTNPILSSAFPFYKDTLFLPKPIGLELLFTEEIRKKMKRVRWVEKELLEKGELREAEIYGKFLASERIQDVYDEIEIVRHTKDRIKELTTVFTVRAFKFSKKSGLYFLYKGDYNIYDVVKVLGEVGVGGGRSIGFGKFRVSEESFDWHSDGDYGLLISKCIPNKNEVQKLGKARYIIAERGGWTENSRKRKLRVLVEGSILPCDVKGRWVVEMVNNLEIYRNYLAFTLPIGW